MAAVVEAEIQDINEKVAGSSAKLVDELSGSLAFRGAGIDGSTSLEKAVTGTKIAAVSMAADKGSESMSSPTSDTFGEEPDLPSCTQRGSPATVANPNLASGASNSVRQEEDLNSDITIEARAPARRPTLFPGKPLRSVRDGFVSALPSVREGDLEDTLRLREESSDADSDGKSNNQLRVSANAQLSALSTSKDSAGREEALARAPAASAKSSGEGGPLSPTKAAPRSGSNSFPVPPFHLVTPVTSSLPLGSASGSRFLRQHQHHQQAQYPHHHLHQHSQPALPYSIPLTLATQSPAVYHALPPSTSGPALYRIASSAPSHQTRYTFPPRDQSHYQPVQHGLPSPSTAAHSTPATWPYPYAYEVAPNASNRLPARRTSDMAVMQIMHPSYSHASSAGAGAVLPASPASHQLPRQSPHQSHARTQSLYRSRPAAPASMIPQSPAYAGSHSSYYDKQTGNNVSHSGSHGNVAPRTFPSAPLPSAGLSFPSPRGLSASHPASFARQRVPVEAILSHHRQKPDAPWLSCSTGPSANSGVGAKRKFSVSMGESGSGSPALPKKGRRRGHTTNESHQSVFLCANQDAYTLPRRNSNARQSGNAAQNGINPAGISFDGGRAEVRPKQEEQEDGLDELRAVDGAAQTGGTVRGDAGGRVSVGREESRGALRGSSTSTSASTRDATNEAQTSRQPERGSALMGEEVQRARQEAEAHPGLSLSLAAGVETSSTLAHVVEAKTPRAATFQDDPVNSAQTPRARSLPAAALSSLSSSSGLEPAMLPSPRATSVSAVHGAGWNLEGVRPGAAARAAALTATASASSSFSTALSFHLSPAVGMPSPTTPVELAGSHAGQQTKQQAGVDVEQIRRPGALSETILSSYRLSQDALAASTSPNLGRQEERIASARLSQEDRPSQGAPSGTHDSPLKLPLPAAGLRGHDADPSGESRPLSRLAARRGLVAQEKTAALSISTPAYADPAPVALQHLHRQQHSHSRQPSGQHTYRAAHAHSRSSAANNLPSSPATVLPAARLVYPMTAAPPAPAAAYDADLRYLDQHTTRRATASQLQGLPGGSLPQAVTYALPPATPTARDNRLPHPSAVLQAAEPIQPGTSGLQRHHIPPRTHFLHAALGSATASTPSQSLPTSVNHPSSSTNGRLSTLTANTSGGKPAKADFVALFEQLYDTMPDTVSLRKQLETLLETAEVNIGKELEKEKYKRGEWEREMELRFDGFKRTVSSEMLLLERRIAKMESGSVDPNRSSSQLPISPSSTTSKASRKRSHEDLQAEGDAAHSASGPAKRRASSPADLAGLVKRVEALEARSSASETPQAQDDRRHPRQKALKYPPTSRVEGHQHVEQSWTSTFRPTSSLRGT